MNQADIFGARARRLQDGRTPGGTSEQQARFAIDGAIQYGRENCNPPPSTDHWLYEYWNIGQQLRRLGETGWDNVAPLAAPVLQEGAHAAREMAQTAAARDVLAERRRQIDHEGYDQKHDDEHVCEEIAAYAAFYAMPPATRDWPAEETGYGTTWGWAIVPDGWRVPEPDDRRRELVKAGALILAEIERLDRAEGQA
jgi:hypothetical protein